MQTVTKMKQTINFFTYCRASVDSIDGSVIEFGGALKLAEVLKVQMEGRWNWQKF